MRVPKITSRPPSTLYAAGWDRIFGKKTVTLEAVQSMGRAYKIPQRPVQKATIADIEQILGLTPRRAPTRAR